MRLIYILSFLAVCALSCCSSDSSTGTPSHSDDAQNDFLLSDSLVTDSLSVDSIHPIPSDSVRVVVEFFDAWGSTLSSPILVSVVDDFLPSYLWSDNKGVVSFMAKSDHVIQVVYAEDTLVSYFDMRGGEELNDHIQLNVLPMYGRIMDNDGTPHQNMPVRVHYRLSKKDRSMACENDLMFHTDSLGYYRTYVSTSFHSIVLRSCGFVFGIIPKKEFDQYPKQNFLFNPFEVENRCADCLPKHEFFLNLMMADGSMKSIPAEKWPSLFAQDESLENMDEVSLQVSFAVKTYTYRLKKKNGAFKLPKMSVCFK